ncbi:MAG: hypothetical protein HXS41_06740 [Theionarchaea archaeon]|nr:hypothetical protein [Theionarchaea archaeon]MBU7020738.1 hypothetical protein [Theionarchaea archaeon]
MSWIFADPLKTTPLGTMRNQDTTPQNKRLQITIFQLSMQQRSSERHLRGNPDYEKLPITLWKEV